MNHNTYWMIICDGMPVYSDNNNHYWRGGSGVHITIYTDKKVAQNIMRKIRYKWKQRDIGQWFKVVEVRRKFKLYEQKC